MSLAAAKMISELIAKMKRVGKNDIAPYEMRVVPTTPVCVPGVPS